MKTETVLVVFDTTEEERQKLIDAAPDMKFIFTNNELVMEKDAKEASFIFGNIKAEYIKDSKKLKVLQLESAGTGNYINPGVMPESATLCNASGAYGVAISEHMVGSLLFLMKRLGTYQKNQENCQWKDEGPVTGIYGSRTLVVGLGDIGGEFAKRMNAMGSSVVAIRRTDKAVPEYIRSVYQLDALKELAGEADIIASALPETDSTKKVFDSEFFKAVKPGAYFLNVGRGTAVDQDALLEALDSGRLAGASVDVTDPEPLPEDHPLWKAQNILITPHISGGHHLQETVNRIVDIAACNLKAYAEGTELRNVVNMTAGY